MHRRSGHQQQRAHEAKRRAGADSGTASSTDDCDEAPYRARHANGPARSAKRQRNAVPSRRHAARRHAPSSGSSSSSTSSSAVALTPYAIEAGAAVAAAYPHAITPGEAATLVATMAAEGAAAAAGDSSDSSDSLQPGTVVADRFALGRVAGSGGFGVVYEAVDMADPHRLRVAIKMEKGEHRVRSLRHEAVVFAALAGGPGVPPVLWSGSATAGDGKRVDVLVMPLLGVSLYDYMRSKSSGHLAPEAVMHIGRYILRYLEHMHARGWLHRDVKPHNFLLDRSRKTIYMVDYGLAKRWCDPRTGAHVEYERRRNRSSVPGTAKYASLNTHQGVVQSRRDDLEALAYTLVQLARGTLPWDSVPGHNKAKRCARIRECKAKTSVEAICDGLPSCFARFLAYARALSFPETPDYNYCRRLFGAKSSSTGHHNNNNNNNRYHGA
ncbi:Serine/threonine protein kinase [Pandoravirus macleodensis]|uniref:Serine/threonine protein kinase n=1 Tax=Pandoravirus macleodensis TaxID=2107707 RepID=A0A2U7UEF9_9VIRU|nr:Serine/threonine protein kinase [Pandoravirus macleodensis]AVK76826.1 Serine/threonine protein kinase [Pandoravirus macleodensis]